MSNGTDDPAFAHDLGAARAGDREALDRLLARLEQQFPEEAERRLGPNLRGKTRASDLKQNAYVEILQRLGEFRGATEATFRAWAGRILHNASRLEYRRLTATKRRQPSRTSQLELLASILLRPEKSAASEVVSLERLELLNRAIESLPSDQRVAIEDCILGGRPAAALAAELGRSPAAVHMLVSRARAALALAVERLDGS
ncbi:MAG: sigma-70 family RNA polymerase sigma factor [Planctomycetes bacterium]|nr:sigma-70 family RNA polymerase sigma factor [Planctomycetota bacterium]